ncbi:hypothetical protein EVAR_79322_1 [Eumeta japonica]|uniref:Uncharacterized protein n=1 Tax=Eumeta variegata TaxID=151549 RepID=A0A4C1TFK2_EUMVA|nr:hypothetical protein EVAR_79322_1 [Eumeta japonica]
MSRGRRRTDRQRTVGRETGGHRRPLTIVINAVTTSRANGLICLSNLFLCALAQFGSDQGSARIGNYSGGKRCRFDHYVTHSAESKRRINERVVESITTHQDRSFKPSISVAPVILRRSVDTFAPQPPATATTAAQSAFFQMFSNDESKDRGESFLLKNKSPASPKTSEVSNRCSNSGRRNIFFSWEGLIWFIQVQYNDARNCRCRIVCE